MTGAVTSLLTPENDKRAFLQSLTLVLQGPLLASNQVDVAATCRRWRSVLPINRIIFAVSTSDLLRPRSDSAADAVHHRMRVFDSRRESPVTTIIDACDTIVFAPRRTPLPPIKRGLKQNNINLQIAAAQTGLARVETEHVLRVRNDIAFADDRFIDHYLARRARARGDEALFDQRVLIAPYFTLNPFGLERLPFHYSDWFHLGRTTDVRRLWDVPPMRKSEASHYRRHAMPATSGRREQLFWSRWAAEQYLTMHALARAGRPVRLDHHDDLTDARASLDILADNFVIADFAETPILFEKYRHLATAPDMDLLCLSDHDLEALVESRGLRPPEATLAAKIAAAERLLQSEAARRRMPLPRRLLRRIAGAIRT